MRTKHVVFAIVATLLLGLLVAPASANKVKDKDGIPGGVKDTGVFSGTAIVGKFRSFCTHDGDSDVHGPGIGMPFQRTKNAYYQLHTTIDSAFKPALVDGVFKICGRLTKMADAAGSGGLGAACGASKGWDGRGTIDWVDDLYPDKDTIWLKDLVWKSDAFGTWIVTGEANQAEEEEDSKDKGKNDFITMTIQAQGGNACLTKQDGPTKHDKRGGADRFVMVGEYTIANKVTGLEGDQNVGPLCKSGLDDGCLYDEKKTGKSG